MLLIRFNFQYKKQYKNFYFIQYLRLFSSTPELNIFENILRAANLLGRKETLNLNWTNFIELYIKISKISPVI